MYLKPHVCCDDPTMNKDSYFASSGWVNSGQLKISVAHNSQMCSEKVFILRKEKRSNYGDTITLILLQVLPRHGCPKEVFYSLGLWLRVKRNEMLSSTMVTGVFADKEEKEHPWTRLTGKYPCHNTRGL